MPVRIQHDQSTNSFYFVTFTCHKWLQLFEITNAYDTVYKWFNHLYKNNIYVTGYVIMPNHVHVLLYFPQMPKSLNTIIGNAKRFVAYEIIKRLEEKKENKLLDLLYGGVKKREQKKGHPDSHRDIKYLKTALMPKNVIVKNSFFKNLIT